MMSTSGLILQTRNVIPARVAQQFRKQCGFDHGRLVDWISIE
jgi:hypothetical protein